MSNVSPFLCGLGATLLASLLAVLYLRAHLRAILIDLCGTAERARFWTAFTNLAFLLVPSIFALNYDPEFGPRSPVLQIAAQFKAALIGLVVAVVVVGFVLGSFISRSSMRSQGKNETRIVS